MEYIKPFVDFMLQFVASLPSLAILVMSLVGPALLLHKAGEAPWKAFIPFYNEYTMLKVTNKKKWFMPYLFGNIVKTISGVATAFFMFWTLVEVFRGMVYFYARPELHISSTWFMLSLIVYIGASTLCLVETVVRDIGIVRHMQISTAYVLGLIFLEPIFMFILGISSRYQWITQYDYSPYGIDIR